MERRHHLRVPIDIETLIYCSGLPVATGLIRNASRFGVLLETECQELHRHQPVQLEFRRSGESTDIRHRVTAHVLRRTIVGCVGEEIALGVRHDQDFFAFDDPVLDTRAMLSCQTSLS